jgi:hypothetical protein
MFRFTIRDLLWLMVVVAILLLWATERQAASVINGWSRIRENEARLHSTIDEQAQAIQKLTAKLKTEQNWRDELMRSQFPELAEPPASVPPPP